MTNRDAIELEWLPRELHYLIFNYNPAAILALPYESMIKYDTLRLLKENYGSGNYPDMTQAAKMRLYISKFAPRTILCGHQKYCRVIDGKLTWPISDNKMVDITEEEFLTNILEGNKMLHAFQHRYIKLENGSIATYRSYMLPILSLENVRDHERKGMKKIQQMVSNPHSLVILFVDNTLITCFNDGDVDSAVTCTSTQMKGVKKIVTGSLFTIILLDDGRVFGFGSNDFGKLGLSRSVMKTDTITEITGLPNKVIDVSCGSDHTILLCESDSGSGGILMASGMGQSGRLGLGDRRDCHEFKRVPDVPNNIINISCGNTFSVIQLSDGKLMCAGTIDDVHRSLKFEHLLDIPTNIYDFNCTDDAVIIEANDGSIKVLGQLWE